MLLGYILGPWLLLKALRAVLFFSPPWAISKVNLFSCHKLGSKLPNILQADISCAKFVCYFYHFFLNVLIGALHSDVATGTGIMAENYFPKTLSSVPARSMDNQRMKENSVSLVHYEMYIGIVLFIVLDPVEH